MSQLPGLLPLQPGEHPSNESLWKPQQAHLRGPTHSPALLMTSAHLGPGLPSSYVHLVLGPLESSPLTTSVEPLWSAVLFDSAVWVKCS